MTFVQRPEGCEGTSCTDIMERILCVELAKCTKHLSLGHDWQVQGYCSWSWMWYAKGRIGDGMKRLQWSGVCHTLSWERRLDGTWWKEERRVLEVSGPGGPEERSEGNAGLAAGTKVNRKKAKTRTLGNVPREHKCRRDLNRQSFSNFLAAVGTAVGIPPTPRKPDKVFFPVSLHETFTMEMTQGRAQGHSQIKESLGLKARTSGKAGFIHRPASGPFQVIQPQSDLTSLC